MVWMASTLATPFKTSGQLPHLAHCLPVKVLGITVKTTLVDDDLSWFTALNSDCDKNY